MNNPDKRYQVIISDKASEMLTRHTFFVANVSILAAEKLNEQILRATRTLEALPQRFPWFNAPMIPRNKYRQLTVSKRYLILYQISGDIVYVDYILDCRQDYQWLL